MVVAGKCYRCFDILRGFQLLQDIGPKWIFRFCQDLLIAHNESHSSSRKCDTNLFGLVMKLITRKLRTTCSKGINNKRSDSCSRKCNIKNYSQGYCGLQTFFSQSLWQGTSLGRVQINFALAELQHNALQKGAHRQLFQMLTHRYKLTRAFFDYKFFTRGAFLDKLQSMCFQMTCISHKLFFQ